MSDEQKERPWWYLHSSRKPSAEEIHQAKTAPSDEPKLVLIEGSETLEFRSYMELLDHVIKQTFEICVNSPEEEDLLTDSERSRLEGVHNAWL